MEGLLGNGQAAQCRSGDVCSAASNESSRAAIEAFESHRSGLGGSGCCTEERRACECDGRENFERSVHGGEVCVRCHWFGCIHTISGLKVGGDEGDLSDL